MKWISSGVMGEGGGEREEGGGGREECLIEMRGRKEC